MAKHVIAIPVPTSVAAGAAVPVDGYGWLSAPVLLLTAGTITVQYQESYDGGTNWFNVGAALTATGKASAVFDRAATHVRANTTAASGATATGHCSGWVGN